VVCGHSVPVEARVSSRRVPGKAITLYEYLGTPAPTGPEHGRTQRTSAIETIDNDRQLVDGTSSLLGAATSASMYTALDRRMAGAADAGRPKITEATETLDYDPPPLRLLTP
jgi:hypothetical protein